MSLSSVPDIPATTPPLEAALAIAQARADRTHTLTRLPVHQDGREVGVLTGCACGWEIVRPSTEDAAVEVALHRVTAPPLAGADPAEGVAAA